MAEEVQARVRKLFLEEGHGHAVSPSFRDFHPSSERKLHEFMQKLVQAAHAPPVAQTLLQKNCQAVMCAIKVASDALADRVNPRLVKTALAIFLTHNKASQQLGVFAPPLKEHLEFQPLQLAAVEKPTKPTTWFEPAPTYNPVTVDTLKDVQTLSYWREDYDINDHHWHWHIVYPWSGINDGHGGVKRTIDRQGELFLYMHSQMLARYNSERLSWTDISLVDPWTYDEVVEPGYTPPPGLRDQYGARPPLTGWLEKYTPYLPEKEVPVPVSTMTFWRNNINKAIIDGYFYTKKADGTQGKFHLTEDVNPMNWVGIVVESESSKLQEVRPDSGEFIDNDLYGSLHNLGHDKFGEVGYQEYTSDKNRWGVMGFTQVAVRDPVFWIWHRHIDDFRQAIVKKFPQHNLKDSAPSNVKLVGVKILPRDEHSETPNGGVATFLTAPQVDLHEVNAKLNHEPYKWEVTVQTSLDESEIKKHPKKFTVRIFMVPDVLKHEQRRWIEMDKFSHTLSTKTDTIIRLDEQSSVARKFSKPPKGKPIDSRCLCGWPQNMMLPNGTPKGTDYKIFAMLTNDTISEDGTQSMSFCGAKDDKYPDPRGMGYPFDKTWFKTYSEMIAKIKGLDHIKVSDFKIYRQTKLYQGRFVTVPGDISWENTIKNFFTSGDASYMKKEYDIDLTKKEDVRRYRMFIYGEVEDGKIPVKGGKWDGEKRAKYLAWIDAGYP